MSVFERYLTIWVFLCIIAGIVLGHAAPGVFHAIGGFEVAKVNLPVAILIWLMIVPMLLKIDFAALRRVGEHWRGIGVTLIVNWGVKPFSMAALGWLFIGHVFRAWLPPDQINSYIAGLILLGAAPCTAMVFVWSNLMKGEPHFTLSQVALNDTIMVFAFAPIVGLLLGLSAITVPWDTLVLSVALYIVVPVIVAQAIRRFVLAKGGEAGLSRLLAKLGPVSLISLLATLVLLFGFQGEQILAQPLVIGLLAAPIFIQVYLNAGIAYGLNRLVGEQHCVAGPSALIGASNFFELAVATAISLFGFNSGAPLATVVGAKCRSCCRPSGSSIAAGIGTSEGCPGLPPARWLGDRPKLTRLRLKSHNNSFALRIWRAHGRRKCANPGHLGQADMEPGVGLIGSGRIVVRPQGVFLGASRATAANGLAHGISTPSLLGGISAGTRGFLRK
jgi:arsenite transporter